MVRVIQLARAKRWFSDARAYELSMEALDRAQAYSLRLETDRLHRAHDGAIRSVAVDPELSKIPFDATFASPYVICMPRGKDESDPAAAIFEPPAVRDARRAYFAQEAAKRARVMGDVGRTLQQVYAEFLRRYGEIADLRDLMGEFGGRPDLPIGKRSFRDGCPLVVWIAGDDDSLRPPPGRLVVWRFDREEDLRHLVLDAVTQLLYWFRRQRNEWGGAGPSPQTFFELGLPRQWIDLTIGAGRTLRWGGEKPWLETLRLGDRVAAASGRTAFRFPLEDLVKLEGYGNVEAYAFEHAGPSAGAAGLAVFAAQSAAFLEFLRDGAGGKRRGAFDAFVAGAFVSSHVDPATSVARFESAFGIRSKKDWKDLDDEFRGYLAAQAATPEQAAAPQEKDDGPRALPEVHGVAAPR
jgi:hypothetical protein